MNESQLPVLESEDDFFEQASLHDHDHPDDAEARMPFVLFIVSALVQLAIAIGAFALIAPTVFREELSHPGLIVLWTFLFGIPLSLFEYLYHRYLLHSAVLPFIGSMKRAHVTHHGLTNVRAQVSAKDPDKFATVKNEYPVEQQHQEESMMFPLYSGLIFNAIFTLAVSLPIKLLAPSQPVIISMLTTVMLCYAGYEIWHGILHLPYEKFWKPLLDHKRFGRMWRYIYGFHLMHHWRPTSNLAVVGFWGVALWDHVFGTHRRPKRMPLKNASVTYRDQALGKPRWPISMLDSWQGGMARGSRKIEAFFAKIFMGNRQHRS